MYFLLKLVLNTVALLAVVKLVPGITVDTWRAAVLAALALGVVNAVIRPVLIVLTFPFNLLTLGLFTFVINAALFYWVSAFVPGFHIANFVTAFVGSLLFSVFSSILSAVAAPSKIRFFSRRSDRGRYHDKYKDAVDVEHRHEDE